MNHQIQVGFYTGDYGTWGCIFQVSDLHQDLECVFWNLYVLVGSAPHSFSFYLSLFLFPVVFSINKLTLTTGYVKLPRMSWADINFSLEHVLML
jgi:hypothetical protein